jgi:ABC-type lipoprotein export system ATPase subunit
MSRTPTDAPGADSPALLIRDLTFSHAPDGGDRPWTLSVSSFTVARGEQVLLTGGSGRGKSTLLYLIAGLIEPQNGVIEVAGSSIGSLRAGSRDRFRGRHIGMIFQTFNLLHGFTAAENVMAALMFSDVPGREHQPRALSLLKTLGLDRPDRLVERLSVGQQQRVAVARALACKPELVLADEPTASLDPENSLAAMDLIQSACAAEGAALLCTSHDPSLADRFRIRTSIDALTGEPSPC